MSYTVKDYPTEAALKRDLEAGAKVRIYNPGLGVAPDNGTAFLEGPHYPKPHSWYAQATMVDGLVTKVK